MKPSRSLLFCLALRTALQLACGAAFGASSTVQVFQTDLVNTGVIPNARGTVDGSMTRQINGSYQRFRILLSGLQPQAAYQLVAYLGDNPAPNVVAELTTDAKGALFAVYVKKCPGNSSPGGVLLPDVLDPVTRIHQVDVVKDGNVLLAGVIGADLPADCTAPFVTSTVPADGATGVATNQDISAVFSESMNPATITPGTFVLRRGAVAVAGAVTCSGNAATFNPSRNLLPNTVYTATLTTRARDLGGNGLSSNVVWTFTTAAARSTPAAALIGYTNAQAVTAYSQAVMNQVGQLRWYFAHASVGDNIKQGLADLHAANPGFYPLRYVSATGTPAGATEAGVVYEYMRGNPGWQAKVDSFEQYVAAGWRAPLVDAVIDKLCWIDQTADVNYYAGSMANLQTAYPQTEFVYTTMPLDTTTGSDNYARNIFNDTLRSWCRANNRVLFDIADIEAHDPSGRPVTFSFNNRVCQRLYSGYTSDGGHPDSAYARQLLARGFYAVSAALSSRR